MSGQLILLGCIWGITVVLILVRTICLRDKKIPQPDVGKCMTIGTREVQEDNFSVLQAPSSIMAVLADGMGGNFGGRIASRVAVNTFEELFQSSFAFDHPEYYFRKAFHAANKEILNTLDDEGKGAASVTAAIIYENKLYYATAGNVQVAVFRQEDLIPVNEGHTVNVLAEQQFKQGSISKQEAASLLHDHRLYNYVGQDSFQDIEMFDLPVTLYQGDIVVLMSDGVYDFLAWREIEQVLSSQKDCNEMAFELIEKINQSVGTERDNASIVLIRI